MKDGYWVIRTYESGLVGEKIKFWVPGTRPGKKMSRRHRSDIRKAVQNEESAVRAMARLLNANFQEGDWLLGLDYSPEGHLLLEQEAYGGTAPSFQREATSSGPSGHLPLEGKALGRGNGFFDFACGSAQNDGRGQRMGGQVARATGRGNGFFDSACGSAQNDGRGRRAGRLPALQKTFLTAAQKMEAIREAAEHQIVNCIRRVKRELEREGVELKYVFVTSNMDGKTGEAVRVHHHLVINREARDAFVRKWQDKGLGGVAWSPLEKQEDYLEIAKYLLAQVRKADGKNQYTSSRNLIRPRPKDRVAASASEVRVPKGCRLLHRQEYKPGKAQYIRYRIERERGPTDGAA